jgi:hypothetical protein
LNSPVDTGASVYQVRPTTNTNHQAYINFYAKITTAGVSVDYFGPYTLMVGCFLSPPASVTFADNAALITEVALIVGDSATYTFTGAEPSTTRVWCTIVDNKIMDAGTGAANIHDGTKIV